MTTSNAVRISVTDLDRFDYFMREAEVEDPAAAFIADKFAASSPRQRMGTALHDQVATKLRHVLPHVSVEVPVKMGWPSAVLSGRVDVWMGPMIWDWKFTFGSVSPKSIERLAESWQWRAYLAMAGAQRFAYVVQEVSEGKESEAVGQWYRRCVLGDEMLNTESVSLWCTAYSGMKDEVRRKASEVADFWRRAARRGQVEFGPMGRPILPRRDRTVTVPRGTASTFAQVNQEVRQ